ncbi:oligosaccharide repeat unit polymerase [Paenibacillus sp. OV219]|uniref:oligosaccharide repeat unit polymerase n=1 Tax=Paenibacillus sp. OV219 TaxID=1884377 RepID=UPI0008ABDBF5|nr:O-antigen polysaccharide polymerase Wzy [Paenibacillus sp. OV219]SEN61700.1 oligosaccharide repeat unit polymerase [Paenibacillus sp. OV219]
MYFRMALSTFIFFLLAILFPLLIVKETGSFSFESNMALSWFIILYTSLKLSMLALSNLQRLLEITFWLFSYIWMGLTPLSHVMLDVYAWPGSYDDNTITFALVIIVLGIISYEIGFLIAKSRYKLLSIPVHQNVNAIQMSVETIPKKWVYVVSIASLVMSVVIISKIGFSSIFQPRLVLDAIYSTAYSKTELLIYSNLQKVPVFVALLFCLIIGKYKKNNSSKNPYLLLTAILFITNILISNPISNARYWFGSVAIALCFIIFRWRKSSSALWIISLVILLLIVFPYSDVYRNSSAGTLVIQNMTKQLTEKGDYDAFQQLLNTIIYVKSNGLSYGYQLLGAVLFWLPRGIWPDKPYGTGQTVAEALGYNFTNFSSPFWAESYVNFGILGVIVMFALYGYVSYILQHKYIESQRRKNSISVLQIIVPFLAAYQLFLLRGDLLNGMAYMSCFLLFSIVFFKGKRWSKAKKIEKIEVIR